MATQTAVLSNPNLQTAKQVGLWALQLGGAAMFLMAGYNKLTGNPDMVGAFEAIGMGQWFRYVTGSIEVVSGIFLLIPALAGVGALLLSATMVGAVLTHLVVFQNSPAVPAVLLVAMLAVAYGRKDRTLRLLGK